MFFRPKLIKDKVDFFFITDKVDSIVASSRVKFLLSSPSSIKISNLIDSCSRFKAKKYGSVEVVN